MTKLTDTQLIVLSAASRRDDRGVVRPGKLKGGSAQKAVAKLLSEGLVEEVRASGTLPVWRRDDGDGSLALRITKRGLKAIQVDDAAGETQTSRDDDKARTKGRSARKKTGSVHANRRKKTSRKVEAKRQNRGARSDSKQATVIAMLGRAKGATVSAIMDATGWQPHSVRGFLAAVVRKKLGLDLISDKSGDERIYRIVAG